MKRTLRSDIVEVTIREAGIVSARAFPGSEIDLEKAISYHGLVEFLTANEPHVTVIDITGVKRVSKEARKFLAKRSSDWGKTIAVAIITNSFTARTIASFFLTVDRPSYPVKVFQDAVEAQQWAKAEHHRFSTKKAS